MSKYSILRAVKTKEEAMIAIALLENGNIPSYFIDEVEQDVKERFYRTLDQYKGIVITEELGENVLLPELFFRTDQKTYYDRKKRHIVIGLLNAFFLLCRGEADTFNCAKFLLRHEMQHVMATEEKAWSHAMISGRKLIYQELADKLEGINRKFKKEKDYKSFHDAMLKKGIFVSDNQIRSICHFVLNAIEDGRIERMAAKSSFMFKNQRMYFRGLGWMIDELDSTDTTDPNECLRILQNQILSLATTGMYQRGYLEALSDDPINDTLDKMVNRIAAGVYAPNCDKCMEAGCQVLELLLPYIVEVVRNQSEDPGVGAPPEQSCGANSRTEKTDEEGSDDYETYEKLMKEIASEQEEEEEESEGSEGPEENEDGEKSANEDSEGENAETSEEADSQEEGAPEGGNTGEDDGSEDAGKGRSESGDEAADSNGNGTNGKDGEEKGDSNGSGETNESNSNADENGNEDSGDAGNKNGSKDSSSNVNSGRSLPSGCHALCNGMGLSNDPKGDLEKVVDMMKKAADGVLQKEAETAISIMKKKPSKDSYVPDTTKPVEPSADLLKKYRKEGINVRFDELKRQYRIDGQMPADLAAQSEHFRKEVEKLFEKEYAPVLRGRRSGKVDPVNIWKLAIQNDDFFAKKQEEHIRTKAVFLLEDNSGSMGYGVGSKRWFSNRALAVIEEGFKEHFPMKIAAFDADASNHVIHEIIKNWDERYPENCSSNFLNKGRWGCGNKDGFSIRVATQELLGRSEDDKLLIVLSDGAPTAYSSGISAESDVAQAVKEARDAGIQVVGIYFSDMTDDPTFNVEQDDPFCTQFKEMYGNVNCVCTTADRIIGELIRVLNNFVFVG